MSFSFFKQSRSRTPQELARALKDSLLALDSKTVAEVKALEKSPTPVYGYTPKNSKKRVILPGSSSWCNEVEVIEVLRLANRSPKPMSSKQKKKVIYGEIIDLDMEEDSDNVQVGAVSNGEHYLFRKFDTVDDCSDHYFFKNNYSVKQHFEDLVVIYSNWSQRL